jgi:hypothetical protein
MEYRGNWPRYRTGDSGPISQLAALIGTPAPYRAVFGQRQNMTVACRNGSYWGQAWHRNGPEGHSYCISQLAFRPSPPGIYLPGPVQRQGKGIAPRQGRDGHLGRFRNQLGLRAQRGIPQSKLPLVGLAACPYQTILTQGKGK